jgi:hypothetical protein
MSHILQERFRQAGLGSILRTSVLKQTSYFPKADSFIIEKEYVKGTTDHWQNSRGRAMAQAVSGWPLAAHNYLSVSLYNYSIYANAEI